MQKNDVFVTRLNPGLKRFVPIGVYFDLEQFVDYHNLGDFWCVLGFADIKSYMPYNFGRNQTRQSISLEYLRKSDIVNCTSVWNAVLTVACASVPRKV